MIRAPFQFLALMAREYESSRRSRTRHSGKVDMHVIHPRCGSLRRRAGSSGPLLGYWFNVVFFVAHSTVQCAIW